MATRIPPEVFAEDELPPWPAYAVILPSGLVPVHDRIANREGFASYVFVERVATARSGSHFRQDRRDPGSNASAPPGRGRVTSRGEPLPEPVTQTFVLTRNVVVDVDCREEIVRHLRGERPTAPAVQVLMRGHWRNQAHGPGFSKRTWKHISPFWRGPEDAPIAVRRHAVQEPTSERPEPA